MLVLSRKEGQTIEFPELDIVVRVIAVKRCRVQLGVEAPQEIAVHRGEKIRELTERGELPDRPISDDPSGLSREEANHVLKQLVRLEAELSAVAELAEPSNRDIAQRVATDAIQRIEGISRSVRISLRQRAAVQPIADLVKIRTEVLNRLRARSKPEPVECCDSR